MDALFWQVGEAYFGVIAGIGRLQLSQWACIKFVVQRLASYLMVNGRNVFVRAHLLNDTLNCGLARILAYYGFHFESFENKNLT